MHLQDALSSYLVAEFLYALGAYSRSNEELPETRGLTGTPIGDRLDVLTVEARNYNDRLTSERYAASPGQLLRRPPPPAPATTDANAPLAAHWLQTRSDCLGYYTTVVAALALPGPGPAGHDDALLSVRRAILLDVEGDSARTHALRKRFESRQAFLAETLGVDEPGPEIAQRAGARTSRHRVGSRQACCRQRRRLTGCRISYSTTARGRSAMSCRRWPTARARTTTCYCNVRSP